MASNNFFDGLSGLGETLSKAAKEWSGIAENIYGTQKMQMKVAGDKRSIDKLMGQIGKILYTSYQNGEEVSEEVQALCVKIDALNKKIEKTQNEMANARGKKLCPECKQEISLDAAFCSACGAPVPTEAPKAEEVSDDELMEEAEEFAEEIAEEAEEFIGEVGAEASELAQNAAEAAAETAEAVIDVTKELVEDAAEAVEDMVKKVTGEDKE